MRLRRSCLRGKPIKGPRPLKQDQRRRCFKRATGDNSSWEVTRTTAAQPSLPDPYIQDAIGCQNTVVFNVNSPDAIVLQTLGHDTAVPAKFRGAGRFGGV
jgi:hypothetical protein